MAIISTYNNKVKNRVEKARVAYNDAKFIKYVNRLLLKFSFERRFSQSDLKKNLFILHFDQDEGKAFVFIGLNMIEMGFEKIEYSWITRYRLNKPFCIQKGRKDNDIIHCQFISVDYFRESPYGKNLERNETVLDDEIAIKLNIGNPKDFICISLAENYKKSDFSIDTRALYQEA